ncbi:competence protein ComF, partial [Cellulomonas bogoriensis 69B4 = DSM 16987]
DLVLAARGRTVAVVPVPTTPGARRRRGADLVAGLASVVCHELRSAGVGAEVVTALRRVGRARDQVGLGARERGANALGSWRVREGSCDVRDTCVVLVDDVLTTGATLAGCERVLSTAGALVLGAVVVAAASPPGQDLVPFLPRPCPG